MQVVPGSKNSIFYQDFSVKTPSSKLNVEDEEDKDRATASSSTYAENYKMHNSKLPQPIALSSVKEEKPEPELDSPEDSLVFKINEESKRKIYNLESLYKYKVGSSADFGFLNSEMIEVPLRTESSPESPVLFETNVAKKETQASTVDYIATRFYFDCEMSSKNLLGEGRFSEVYKGSCYIPPIQNTIFNESTSSLPFVDCAVKRVHNDPESVEFAFAEIEILKKFRNHPFIVNILVVVDEKCLNRDKSCEITVTEDLPIIQGSSLNPRWNLLLEFMDSGNLNTFQESHHKVLTKSLFNKWGFQLASAIKTIHEFGIVHHDIKPQNILVNRDLCIKLADFGHARVIPQDGILNDGFGRGTTTYTTPEILSNLPYTKSIDIYAFGVVLYTMITNNPPFSKIHNPIQLLLSVKKGFFECGMNMWNFKSGKLFYFDGNEPILEEELISLVEKCLSVNPDNRPSAEFSVEYFSNKLKS